MGEGVARRLLRVTFTGHNVFCLQRLARLNQPLTITIQAGKLTAAIGRVAVQTGLEKRRHYAHTTSRDGRVLFYEKASTKGGSR
jgi:hypothetical protein